MTPLFSATAFRGAFFLSFASALALAAAACSDAQPSSCAALPCPAPGWDPVTCQCRHPVAADASANDGGVCALTSPPACGTDGGLDCAATWAEALARFPKCDPAPNRGIAHLARCAGVDAVVSFGIDDGGALFYDRTGKLAGERSYGFSSRCETYDPSFVPPGPDVGCVPLAGQCPADGGAPDADAARCSSVPCPSAAAWDPKSCRCVTPAGECSPVVARAYDPKRDCYGPTEVIPGICVREMLPETTMGTGEMACLVAPDGTRYASPLGVTQSIETSADAGAARSAWSVECDMGLWCDRYTLEILPDGGRFDDPACDAAIGRGQWTHTAIGNPELTFTSDGGLSPLDGGPGLADGGPSGAFARECP